MFFKVFSTKRGGLLNFPEGFTGEGMPRLKKNPRCFERIIFDGFVAILAKRRGF